MPLKRPLGNYKYNTEQKTLNSVKILEYKITEIFQRKE